MPVEINSPYLGSAICSTYHQCHSNGLRKGGEYDQDREHPPALFPFLFASNKQDREGCECHAFQNNRERHKKPDRPPHAAEIPVIPATVIVTRELYAMHISGAEVGVDRRRRDIGVGTSLMQAIGVMYRLSCLARVSERRSTVRNIHTESSSYAIQLGTMIEATVIPEAARRVVSGTPHLA